MFYYGKKDSHNALSPADVHGNKERILEDILNYYIQKGHYITGDMVYLA